MQSLEALKRKIGSAEDLQSVVSTMKTLAAVSIRQYETAVESLTDHVQTVEDGLRMALWHSSVPLQSPAVDRGTGAIVFGSDQGMCGQFNEQIVNYAIESLPRVKDGRDLWSFAAVGARAALHLQEAGFHVDSELPVPGSATGITPLVQDLLLKLDDWHTRRRFGRIVLYFNRRQSASSYHPHQMQLLPLDAKRVEQLKQRTWPARTLPMFTMGRSRLFSSLIHQYLFISLFRACAESLAGENASRIASMQSAERNIEERLAELRAGYNQLRQTSITEELLDVVTGFEALMQELKP
ncbi:F0F1 ATP synthase subunit gamma [Symmachiella dynata]|uniref:F0F1 ATP synthase subunit gamma n=1 Tax=Symmachiella dynata TaxID=2527995 RepID=UPI0030EEAFCA